MVRRKTKKIKKKELSKLEKFAKTCPFCGGKTKIENGTEVCLECGWRGNPSLAWLKEEKGRSKTVKRSRVTKRVERRFAIEYSREDFVRDIVECLVRATYGETDMLYEKVKQKDGVSAIYSIVKTLYSSLKKRRFLIMTDLEAINDYLKTFETVPKFNVNKALLYLICKLMGKEDRILQLVKTDKTPIEEGIQILLDKIIKKSKSV